MMDSTGFGFQTTPRALARRPLLTLLGAAFVGFVWAAPGRVTLGGQLAALGLMLVAWVALRLREARAHGHERIRPTRGRLLAAGGLAVLGGLLALLFAHPLDADRLPNVALGAFVLGGAILELVGLLPAARDDGEDEPRALNPGVFTPGRWASVAIWMLLGGLVLAVVGIELVGAALAATERFEQLRELEAWAAGPGVRWAQAVLAACAALFVVGVVANGLLLRALADGFWALNEGPGDEGSKAP